MTRPTWRGPPSPSIRATSPYATTRPLGTRSTRSSTRSANGVGRPGPTCRILPVRAAVLPGERRVGWKTPPVVTVAPVETRSDRGVVVVEPRLPRRARRPADLLRLVLALLLLV